MSVPNRVTGCHFSTLYFPKPTPFFATSRNNRKRNKVYSARPIWFNRAIKIISQYKTNIETEWRSDSLWVDYWDIPPMRIAGEANIYGDE